MEINNTIFKQIKTVIVYMAFMSSLSIVAMQGASAKDYKVEVLLFENNNPSSATESHDYEAPKPMRSNSETWELEASMLVDEASSLKESANYSIKSYYTWGQKALPYRESAIFNVIERETQGFIKVYADHLLFVNIDLDHKGFRMTEKRRLKLNEKHFFDHPKFGLLIQVSRLEPSVEVEEEPLSLEQAR